MCVDLDDIKRVVADFEVDKNRALCENEQLQQEINGFKCDISQLQRINEKLCDDLEENDRIIKQLQNENCKLEECLRAKDMEISHLKKLFEKVKELKSYVCHLEHELETTSKIMNSLEDKMTELSRCIQEKDSCIRRLENKLRNLEGMIQELEETVKCLSDENRSLKSQLVECRQCLERTLEELQVTIQRLKQCEVDKHMLQCQVNEMEQCLDNANSTLKRECKCNSQLKEELQRLQDENQKLGINNACLKQENCELVKKLDFCYKNLQSCQCEYTRVKEECDAFKRCIGEFKNQIVAEIKTNVPVTPACSVIPRRARSINVPCSKRSNRTRTPRNSGLYEIEECPPCKRPEVINNNSCKLFVPVGLPKTLSFTLKKPKSRSREGCNVPETQSAKYRRRFTR